jgi:hypothetical protein
MATVTDPRSLLGKWLKDHPHSNLAHRVLRFDRETLVSYCGRVFPMSEAVEPVQSVACCPDCTGKWRQQRKRFKR